MVWNRPMGSVTSPGRSRRQVHIVADRFQPAWGRDLVCAERPDRTVRGRRLTSQEYDAYQAATGRIAYPMLQDLIAPAAWDALPQDDKQEAVRDLMREARAAARAEVLGGPAPRGMFGSRAPRRSSLPDLPEGFELVQ